MFDPIAFQKTHRREKGKGQQFNAIQYIPESNNCGNISIEAPEYSTKWDSILVRGNDPF